MKAAHHLGEHFENDTYKTEVLETETQRGQEAWKYQSQVWLALSAPHLYPRSQGALGSAQPPPTAPGQG